MNFGPRTASMLSKTAALAILAGVTSAGFGSTPIPNAELHVQTRLVDKCCYDFDLWQVAGSLGDVVTVVATLPPGASVSGASNGWTGGPAPVVSGGTITWTIPAPGLTNQWPPMGPQYTVRVCFNSLTTPTPVTFTGRSAGGYTSSLLTVQQWFDGPACTAPSPCPTDCPPQSRIQICYDGGRDDAFAAPTDPTTPRSAYATWLAAPPANKDYDDTTVNRQFGTSFQNLPCGIVGARLVIKLRAENDIPQNDSIALMYNNASSFFWGSSIATLNGGSWNAGNSNTFSLNLAALPGGVNLLPQMNLQKALDVYVQDDTTVESAKLFIEVCPCDGAYRYYQSGAADSFASTPVDAPTSRQPRLNAVRNSSPFLWKDYDDCTIDRGVGHTFTGLLGGVVRSDLTLRAKACGSTGAVNDSLHLELLNDGAPIIPYSGANFYAGLGFAALNSGIWNPGTVQTFTINLGTTPSTNGCSNILGALADTKFDYYVQDDTAVDYARLRIQPCPPIKRVFGTIYIPAGLPDIRIDPGLRGLLIPNIGTSGDDGVSFDVRGAEGFRLAFPPGMTGLDRDGASRRISLGGEDEAQTLFTLESARVGHAIRCTLPASRPALWRLIDSRSGTVAEGPANADTRLMLEGDLMNETFTWRTVADAARRKHVANFSYGTLRLTTPDGRTLEGTSLEFEFDAPPELSAEHLTTKWTAPTGSTMPVAVTEGGPIQFGLLHTSAYAVDSALGLDTSPGLLALSNVGPSGLDGVEVHLDGQESYAARLSLGCAEAGGSCTDGDVSVLLKERKGPESVEMGRSSIRMRPGSFDLGADFGPCNTRQVTVRIEREGSVVAEYMLDGQTAAVLGEGLATIAGFGTQPEFVDGRRVPSLWWEFDRPIAFLTHGGTPRLMGDTVRMIASSPAADFEQLTSAIFTTSNTRELIFGDELVTASGSSGSCAPCAADFNQDGGIDGGDIDAFLASWSAGEPCSDVNKDGGTDFSDIDLFFGQWERGGC